MKHSAFTVYLFAECFAVFALLPALLALTKPHGWIYSLLWIALFLCLRTLKKHHAYHFRSDWNEKALRWDNFKPLLIRFFPFALFLLVFVWFMIPEHFLSLPRNNILLWMMVMVLYPAISVIPQELVFRSFFMTRYALIFSRQASMIIANGLAFGWVHIVLHNWVAVVFSAVGGFLFAHTYRKHRSLALCCAEHALYGCFLFTIGMGFYFYHGTVR